MLNNEQFISTLLRISIRPVGDYVDEALTGTNIQRPGFQRMLEDASKRNV